MVIIITTIEIIADFLQTQNKGTIGTDIFCYRWGGGANDAILVTSTGGLNPERFIDGDVSRICETFINILVRNNDFETGLSLTEDLLKLFEDNLINGLTKNKPKHDEPKFVYEEDTTTGKIYYFGIDLNAQYVKTNI